jgi:hypothetical protein
MNRTPLFLLGLLLVVFRLLGAAVPESLPNFQPLPALLLCALVLLDGRGRWLLPLGVWLATDPLVSALHGHDLLGWHHLALPVGIGAVAALALPLRRHAHPAALLGGSALAALAFYFLTNCVSFATLPMYAKTWGGFVQAQWSGPEGFGPTWAFLRNGLVANLLFTALVLLARRGVALADRSRPVVLPAA